MGTSLHSQSIWLFFGTWLRTSSFQILKPRKRTHLTSKLSWMTLQWTSTMTWQPPTTYCSRSTLRSNTLRLHGNERWDSLWFRSRLSNFLYPMSKRWLRRCYVHKTHTRHPSWRSHLQTPWSTPRKGTLSSSSLGVLSEAPNSMVMGETLRQVSKRNQHRLLPCLTKLGSSSR